MNMLSWRGAAFAVALLFILPTSVSAAPSYELVSPNQDAEWNGSPYDPVISANGRYVAFTASDSTLVPGDTNGQDDVFVTDRKTGETTLISKAPDGTPSDGYSTVWELSADGRYVVFESYATTLLPGAVDSHVYVYDQQTGELERADVRADGGMPNNGVYGSTISGDGRYVAFLSYATDLIDGDTNGRADIFVKDRVTGAVTRVQGPAQPNHGSYAPRFAAAADKLVFQSAASNLVPDDNDLLDDIFRYDASSGELEMVSTRTDGSEITDGSLAVPYASASGDLVAFYGTSSTAVPGDANGQNDAFLKNMATGELTIVSTRADGGQADRESRVEAVTDSGLVLLESWATNLVDGDTDNGPDIFVKDTVTGTVERLALTGAGGSSRASVTGDGGAVAFDSNESWVASDVNGGWDIYVQRIDQTAPTSSFSAPPVELDAGASATFSFTSNEPFAWFECKLDSGSWTDCASPRSVTGLAAGAHTFAVRATDPAGNQQPAATTHNFTVKTNGGGENNGGGQNNGGGAGDQGNGADNGGGGQDNGGHDDNGGDRERPNASVAVCVTKWCKQRRSKYGELRLHGTASDNTGVDRVEVRITAQARHGKRWRTVMWTGKRWKVLAKGRASTPVKVKLQGTATARTFKVTVPTRSTRKLTVRVSVWDKAGNLRRLAAKRYASAPAKNATKRRR